MTSISRPESCSTLENPFSKTSQDHFLAFAGQIFQFFARPGNVDNYGFNFTLRHPLSLWMAQNDENDTFENLVLGPKCIGPKLFQAKIFLGRSIIGAEYVWAKVVLGPNWV